MVLIYSASNSFAMKPDKHRVVTGKALEYYHRCLKDDNINDQLSNNNHDFKKNSDFIIMKFSKEEDDAFSLLKVLFLNWKRLYNWHFYDQYEGTIYAMGKDYSYLGPITWIKPMDKSLHEIFNERIESLQEAIEDNDEQNVYKYTGRIMHYIQDMSVPAHVTPNYHDSEDLSGADYFDSMGEWEQEVVPYTADLCPSSSSEPNPHQKNITYINDILKSAAEITRARLQQKITEEKFHYLSGKTWEQMFWNIRDPEKDEEYKIIDNRIRSGFAPYGKLGRYGFKFLCESTKYTDRELCLGFFKESYKNAIKSSIELLFFVNKIIDKTNKAEKNN
jgi:hypothetical protein